jgi:hypothetical protein
MIYLYFRTVHIVIFILFKTNSCTPFYHTLIFTFKTLKSFKMFFKTLLKTLHVSVTTVWPSSGGRLSSLVPLLNLRLFASSSCLSGMWLYVVYVCVCVCVCPLYLFVGCLVVNDMIKLIFALRNFAKASKNNQYHINKHIACGGIQFIGVKTGDTNSCQ